MLLTCSKHVSGFLVCDVLIMTHEALHRNLCVFLTPFSSTLPLASFLPFLYRPLLFLSSPLPSQGLELAAPSVLDPSSGETTDFIQVPLAVVTLQMPSPATWMKTYPLFSYVFKPKHNLLVSTLLFSFNSFYMSYVTYLTYYIQLFMYFLYPPGEILNPGIRAWFCIYLCLSA